MHGVNAKCRGSLAEGEQQVLNQSNRTARMFARPAVIAVGLRFASAALGPELLEIGRNRNYGRPM